MEGLLFLDGAHEYLDFCFILKLDTHEKGRGIENQCSTNCGLPGDYGEEEFLSLHVSHPTLFFSILSRLVVTQPLICTCTYGCLMIKY